MSLTRRCSNTGCTYACIAAAALQSALLVVEQGDEGQSGCSSQVWCQQTLVCITVSQLAHSPWPHPSHAPLSSPEPHLPPVPAPHPYQHCSYELAQDAGEGDHITAFFKPSSSSSTLPSSGGSTFSRTEPAPLVAVKAQLLVASDGYFSRVRKQCLADGPPVVRGGVDRNTPWLRKASACTDKPSCLLVVAQPALWPLFICHCRPPNDCCNFQASIHSDAIVCCAVLCGLQWDGTLLWRARLPHQDAAAVGFDLVDGSVYVQDVGRFLFTYPTSSGDMVWTVGCHGE